MKKRLFAKNTCYDWLVNYIPELIKTMGGVKDKIMSLFETHTTRIMVNQSMSAMTMGVERNQKFKIKMTIRRQQNQKFKKSF